MYDASQSPIVEDLSLGALLAAVGDEIARLATDCRDVEAAVYAVTSDRMTPEMTRRLQMLDSVIQRTEGLAGVLSIVAAESPDVQMSAARVLGGVTLSALARRLAGLPDAVTELQDEYW